MSFQVTISGHSAERHNAEVQQAVDAAVAVLNTVPGVTGSVTGYSNDSETVTFDITLGDAAVAAPEPEPTTEEATSG